MTQHMNNLRKLSESIPFAYVCRTVEIYGTCGRQKLRVVYGVIQEFFTNSNHQKHVQTLIDLLIDFL